eukprot:TRINITY_DN44380_c0_g1_i1.p1 TRINITY_DN44380_c0_g1~~TRINITY_DN44380_c0_g1_i1.p1  ORF type:complete len:978 (-),score=171.58 TRINITY_DN44380_c0_g1_i1:236-3169(-)
MMKQAIFTEVELVSTVASQWGCADPYLVFKSHLGAPVATCDVSPGDRSPHFKGPFTVSFGGWSNSTEQIKVEVWSHGQGAVGADEIVEFAVFSLDNADSEGRQSWPLSKGGQVTASWKVTGRDPKPLATDASVTRKAQIFTLKLQDLVYPVANLERKSVYAILTGLSTSAEARWSTRETAEWTESQWLPYDSVGYRIDVWCNHVSGDIHTGFGQFSLPPIGNVHRVPLTLTFQASGTAVMDYKVDKEFDVGDTTVVVRKELRHMSENEQTRFAKALNLLMENKKGPRGDEYPQSSEFYRIASYHGFPNQYCEHAQESFGVWHRAYLVDLEQCLRRADKELGGDGNIGLPYWDWSQVEVDGQFVPKIIREFFGEMQGGLVSPTVDGAPLVESGYTQIRSDEDMKASLLATKIIEMASGCLLQNEHWMFMSNRNLVGYNLEEPHNEIHVLSGFPMNDNGFAAYHPLFFLHHCNVDRIYQGFVQKVGIDACLRDFAKRQQQLASQGEFDRFRLGLLPFHHPVTQQVFMPADSFDTKSIGYVYDAIPVTPEATTENEDRVVVAFTNVRVLELKGSYDLHVFIDSRCVPGVHTSEINHSPQGGPRKWTKDRYYAGHTCIFAGKGPECKNCVFKDEFTPLTVSVEIQDALARLGVPWHLAKVKVLCEDRFGRVVPVSEIPSLQPQIIGPPVGCDGCATLSSHSVTTLDGVDPRVKQLQHLLARFGYFDGRDDGRFSQKTELAVRKFQKAYGLPEDGVASPEVQKCLNARRMDLSSDLPIASDKRTRRFVDGSPVCFVIGPIPGYLDEVSTHTEVAEAFGKWGDAMGVKFNQVGSSIGADIYVKFADLGREGKPICAIPRRGEQLAMTTPQVITLNAGERWLLRDEAVSDQCPKAVRLYPVVLHQIGHCLGLTHSQNRTDVMWPLYDNACQTLSSTDKIRAKALVVAPSAEEQTARAVAALQAQERRASGQSSCRVRPVCGFFR